VPVREGTHCNKQQHTATKKKVEIDFFVSTVYKGIMPPQGSKNPRRRSVAALFVIHLCPNLIWGGYD